MAGDVVWRGQWSSSCAGGESGESSPVTTSPLPFLHPIAASRPHPRSANLLTLSQQLPGCAVSESIFVAIFAAHAKVSTDR